MLHDVWDIITNIHKVCVHISVLGQPATEIFRVSISTCMIGMPDTHRTSNNNAVVLAPIFKWSLSSLIFYISFQVQSISYLLVLLPFSGFLSFLQNIAAFSMLSAVSPVSYSVASSTKRIVIITVSLVLLRNPITWLNAFGMGLAVCGVLLYNKVKLWMCYFYVEYKFSILVVFGVALTHYCTINYRFI